MSEATLAAQREMTRFYGIRRIGPPGREPSVLIPDGKWGTYTQFAYLGLPAEYKERVDDVLAKLGSTPEKELNNRNMQKFRDMKDSADQRVIVGLKQYYDTAAVIGLVRRGLEELGARDRLKAAGISNPDSVISVIASDGILRLEAARGPTSGTFDAFSKARASSASGLFQFIVGTWNATVTEIRKAVPTISIPLGPTTQREAASKALVPGGPFDARASAYAFGWFTVSNAVKLAQARLPITMETLYTLHQQGSGGGVRYLLGRGGLTAASAQSPASLAVIAAARNQSSMA